MKFHHNLLNIVDYLKYINIINKYVINKTTNYYNSLFNYKKLYLDLLIQEFKYSDDCPYNILIYVFGIY